VAACCEECLMTCCKEYSYAGDDESFVHKDCLARHHKNCPAKSRAERKYAAAKQELEDTEEELRFAKSDMKRDMKRVSSLTLN
jgi:hypothetical protein